MVGGRTKPHSFRRGGTREALGVRAYSAAFHMRGVLLPAATTPAQPGAGEYARTPKITLLRGRQLLKLRRLAQPGKARIFLNFRCYVARFGIRCAPFGAQIEGPAQRGNGIRV